MSAVLTRGQSRLRQRLGIVQPTPEPDFTSHMVYDQSDGLWYVTCRVTATGQLIRCGYYQRPTDEGAARIAARLYGLRRLDVAE